MRGTSRRPGGADGDRGSGHRVRAGGPRPGGDGARALRGHRPLSSGCSVRREGSREARPIHGPRLESLLAKLVDSPVRGFAYEAAGSVGRADLCRRARRSLREAAERWRIPVTLLNEGAGRVRLGRSAQPRAVADLLSEGVALEGVGLRRGVRRGSAMGRDGGLPGSPQGSAGSTGGAACSAASDALTGFVDQGALSLK